MGLFKDYINNWLKIKEEASGFPFNCTTLEEKQLINKSETEEKLVHDIPSTNGRTLTFNEFLLLLILNKISNFLNTTA